MTLDLEQLLREGIDRLTADAKLRPGMVRRARRDAARRRFRLVTAVSLAATAVLVACGLTVVHGRSPGVSPAVAKLLGKIATVAERQPVPQVRNSQFWYIKSRVSSSVCEGGSINAKCVLEKPHERQIWQSVSNLCVPGLLRESGRDTPLRFSGNAADCPFRGAMNAVTYRFLQSLPTDPHRLLGLIERDMAGQQPASQEAFTTIGDLIRESVVPPRVSAALYRAAALIPGVTIVRNAADAIGRRGIAVAMTSAGVKYEWIFSKQTWLYLGERDVNVPAGSVSDVTAVLQRAFVNHAGELPG